MIVVDLLVACERLGVILATGEQGTLRANPPGVLPEDLRAQLRAHKQELWQLLTAPPADVLSDEPCPICGSQERWQWLDGRLFCRVCVVLDLAPLTLVRSGWDRHARQEDVA
jgi:hypothetical protein